MSYTKQEIINDAFEEIGLATYNFDLQPEQLQSSLRKLDRMMASWNGKGIRLRYPIPSNPGDSSLDEETNVPDSANEAIALNLAIRIAPSFGKQVSRELKASAKEAFQVLLLRAIKPVEQQITDLPRGAGNKPWRYDGSEFLDDANTDPLQIGEGGNLEFL